MIFLCLFCQILLQLKIGYKIKFRSFRVLVSGLLIIEILCILIYFTNIKGNLNLDEKPYSTSLNELYYQPFLNQIELDSTSNRVDSLKNFKYSVDQLATIISTKSILFHNANLKKSVLIKETTDEISILNSIIKARKSREIDTSHTDKRIYSRLNKFITMLDSTELTAGKLKSINRISNFIRRGAQIVLYQAEINYEAEAKKAKESAVLLLRFEQLFEVIIVLFIIVVLLVSITLLSKFKSQDGKLLYVKTTLIVYLLILFQLMKPIDPRHIDINDAGWPFTQANWYLPGYFQ